MRRKASRFESGDGHHRKINGLEKPADERLLSFWGFWGQSGDRGLFRDSPVARGKRPIFERLSDDGRLLGYQVNIRKRGFPTVSRQFQRAAEKTGCVGPHFHHLRHEATSRFFERGLDVMKAAAITGHKTLQMLKRYTHLRAKERAAMSAAGAAGWYETSRLRPHAGDVVGGHAVGQ